MTQLYRRFDFLSKRARQGVSLLWIIIAFPALILFLVFAVEIGNIWLARIELEQSLEANALAAVKQWAEGGGGDTEEARIVGNAFSIANPVRGVPLDLTDEILNTAFNLEDLNYDPAMANGNAECPDISDYPAYLNAQEGVMVFGAITQTENLTDSTMSVVFDADEPPSCTPNVLGGAPLLFDVTGLPNGPLGNALIDNAWGISLGLDDDGTSSALRVNRIEIDVDPDSSASNGYRFDEFSVGGNQVYARISNNIPSLFPFLPDNYFRVGHLNSADVNFDIKDDGMGGIDESVLVITFGANASEALLTGERFRFGARVRSAGGSNVGADNLGQGTATTRTKITVFYEDDMGVQPPFEAYLNDTMHQIFGSDGCRLRFSGPDALFQFHYTGHPEEIPDLPCPLSNNPNENGQSFVATAVGGLVTYNHFAVRTQATIGVPSVVQSICGFELGPWGVSAKATAYYDCEAGDAKLIRVDVFECDHPPTN